MSRTQDAKVARRGNGEVVPLGPVCRKCLSEELCSGCIDGNKRRCVLPASFLRLHLFTLLAHPSLDTAALAPVFNISSLPNPKRNLLPRQHISIQSLSVPCRDSHLLRTPSHLAADLVYPVFQPPLSSRCIWEQHHVQPRIHQHCRALPSTSFFSRSLLARFVSRRLGSAEQ